MEEIYGKICEQPCNEQSFSGTFLLSQFYEGLEDDIFIQSKNKTNVYYSNKIGQTLLYNIILSKLHF